MNAEYSTAESKRAAARARIAAWRAANPERMRAARRRYAQKDSTKRLKKAWRDANRQKRRDSKLKFRYGITAADYAELIAKQQYGCAICGGSQPGRQRARFCVDHDHASGVIRGLLCVGCNVGIGNFKDRPEALSAAANYLETGGTWLRDVIESANDSAPNCVRRAKLKHKYGITHGAYIALLTLQDSRCAICKTTSTGKAGNEYFCIDHSHDSGAIRGLLCFQCNKGLGDLKDNPATMRAAAAYLARSRP